MEVDSIELVTNGNEKKLPRFKQKHWLNSAIGVTVALLATFMGICKVKDDNIVQAMQQAQADKIDHWNFYQARNLREEIAEAMVVSLQLILPSTKEELKPQFQAQIKHYQNLASEQHMKKEILKLQAEKDQKTYDDLNFIDDQFDISDAAIAISISLLAISSLTELTWLFLLALFPSVFGIVMGLSGLLGWAVHPDALIKYLN